MPSPLLVALLPLSLPAPITTQQTAFPCHFLSLRRRNLGKMSVPDLEVGLAFLGREVLHLGIQGMSRKAGVRWCTVRQLVQAFPLIPGTGSFQKLGSVRRKGRRRRRRKRRIVSKQQNCKSQRADFQVCEPKNTTTDHQNGARTMIYESYGITNV